MTLLSPSCRELRSGRSSTTELAGRTRPLHRGNSLSQEAGEAHSPGTLLCPWSDPRRLVVQNGQRLPVCHGKAHGDALPANAQLPPGASGFQRPKRKIHPNEQKTSEYQNPHRSIPPLPPPFPSQRHRGTTGAEALQELIIPQMFVVSLCWFFFF